jgi:hypothetical protein
MAARARASYETRARKQPISTGPCVAGAPAAVASAGAGTSHSETNSVSTFRARNSCVIACVGGIG